MLRSSELAAALGVAKYTTQRELWERRQEGYEPPADDLARRMGRRMEQAVLDEYAELHGVIIDTPQVAERGIIRGIADGVDKLNKVIIEAKTTTSYARKSWGDWLLPDYFWQVQSYMYLYNMDKAIVAVFETDTKTYMEYSVDFAHGFDEALAAATKFYSTYLAEPNLPAPPDTVMQSEPGKQYNADDDTAEKWEQYRYAKEQIKVYESQADEALTYITAAMGDAETLVVAGLAVATYKSSTVKRVDIAALPEDIKEKYTKQSEVRTFRIKRGRA